MATTEIAVEGCALDGVAAREHGKRWHPSAGFHTYVRPDSALIHGRMRTLREAAAVERYALALQNGLSDYEAREEGWPTHG